MRLIVLMIIGIFWVQTPLLAQTPVNPGPDSAQSIAASIHLSFQFPKSILTLNHQDSKLKDGSKIDRFFGANDNAFRAELNFIHSKRDLAKINIWGVLGQIARNAIEASNLTMTRMEYIWVDSLPSIRFESKPKNGSQGAYSFGQFTLCSDGVLFAQTVCATLDPRQKAESELYFGSIKRPGFERPKGYDLSLGKVVFTYPPGILPFTRDGFLQLEDQDGEIGLLIRVEEDPKNDKSEIICALAQSLDSMATSTESPLSLHQGPGKLRNAGMQLPAWGFAGRLAPTKDPESGSRSKDVFVRYYQIKGQRIFVSAFAKTPAVAKSEGQAAQRVRAILNSFRAGSAH